LDIRVAIVVIEIIVCDYWAFHVFGFAALGLFLPWFEIDAKIPCAAKPKA
jgi:hypothetical protein